MRIPFALALSFTAGCTDGSQTTDSGSTAATFEVLPPGADLGGMTLAERGADWWRWALEHPVTGNPVMDETGADCEEGQSGDVFYLAGTFTGASAVDRTCTTAHSGPFLIPIVNQAWDNCGTPTQSLVSDADMIAGIETALDQVDTATLTIDGMSVGSTVADFEAYRTEVTAYSWTNPPTDSLYALWGYPFDGVCDPSYAGGYYVPFTLEPGEHQIDLTGGNSTTGFSLDVHYTLTVE